MWVKQLIADFKKGQIFLDNEEVTVNNDDRVRTRDNRALTKKDYEELGRVHSWQVKTK